MSRIPAVVPSTLAAVFVAGAFTVGPVRADDLSCKPVAAAMTAQAAVAYHASIVANGKQGAEEIYTTDAIYRGTGGHWVKIPATPQERLEANKAVGASLTGCHQLREEAVDGQSATVYSAHAETKEPATTSDIQIWIGKGKGLPLRLESSVTMGRTKLQVSKHYDYTNIKAPAGAN